MLAINGLLVQVSFFSQLPPKVIEALAAAAACSRYAAGAAIFLEGDPTAGLYLVESGVVKISRLSREGREHILLMVQPGQTFNEVSVLDGGPNPATATAHTDVVLWRISRQDMKRIAQRHPALSWALVEDLAGRARYLVDLVEDLAMRSVRGRLARLLLEQAQENQTSVVPRMLTQEEMAARLGTVREMVGRTLRSLAAEGVLEFDRHRIVVLDEKRLAREAQI